ncbi:MAG: lipopolysaccharide kinase InaA family protein [Bacteroidota bacterium]
MQHTIHPDFKTYSGRILKHIEDFGNSGELVFGGARNEIRSIDIKGEKFNVKSFKIPHKLNAIIYKYFRPSKARRSFEYASKLLNLGISTPQPVAYFEFINKSGLSSSYYVSRHIDYDLDFRELIHNQDYPEREKILQRFTEFTYRLHENDINFLDHSPGNTLIEKTSSGYKFYLIDLNRMRFEKMNFNQRMHNFRRLWLSKAMIKIMAKTYADLYGKSFIETYDLMLEYSRQFQKKINFKKLRRMGRRPKFKDA